MMASIYFIKSYFTLKMYKFVLAMYCHHFVMKTCCLKNNYQVEQIETKVKSK
jgi:hypothetical protein